MNPSPAAIVKESNFMQPHHNRRKDRGRALAGFTLVEMLTVIAVMVILAGLILGSLRGARERGRKTQCMNNMRNLALAVQMYRDDHYKHEIKDPPWLSTMHGRSEASSQKVYFCPNDRENGQLPPRTLYSKLNPTGPAYNETHDHINNPDPSRNGLYPEFTGCSFLYEFCYAIKSGGFGAGRPWVEIKLEQMNEGDQYSNYQPYSHTDFAMIRCFWHMETPSGGRREVMNISYGGRAFQSGVAWQETVMGD